MAKKRANAHVKRAVRAKAPAKALAAKKPMSLYYPKPDEMGGKVRMEPPKIPQPSEPIDISPMPSLSRMSEPRKKPYHDAAIAVAGAAALSGSIALFFFYVISLDAVYSLVLALTFFIGLSILFYEFLELAERAK